MQWSRLLSQKRPGIEQIKGMNRDLRSEFEKDYHRIIVSASFRRLQDKTQVFPLDKSDFIRTRLTHSLEVSSIARSLGQNIATAIISEEIDPEFTPEMQGYVCELLESAGLIHDIGNPPFGHFGEETIRAWFDNHLCELRFEGKEADEILDRAQMLDLLHFEGNAQGLRMVSKLDYPLQNDGMNLTYGLLSAIIKYPTSSEESDHGSEDVRRRKNGYFSSEAALFREIAEETGTGKSRNPLAFILEAADDIAYSTADIEDAFKKGFFGYETLLREFSERGLSKNHLIRLTDIFDLARLTGIVDPEEYAVRNWLREMQDELLISATDGFISHYWEIMEGTYSRELIRSKPAAGLLKILKSTAYDYAFTSMSIFKTEIAANQVLNSLMDMLVPAACSFGSKNPGFMDEKYLSLIPDNYMRICKRASEGRSQAERLFARIQMAADTVTGMTDSYAKDLFSELTGMQ